MGTGMLITAKSRAGHALAQASQEADGGPHIDAYA